MNMTIFFDLDGTCADTYRVDNWFDKLRQFDASPYREAKPIGDFRQMARQLNRLQAEGYRLGIITWLSKESTPEYDAAVRVEKRKWLAKHLPSVYWDEVHMVKYGTPKQRFMHTPADILFDDNVEIREKWTGTAFTPEEIMAVLRSL